MNLRTKNTMNRNKLLAPVCFTLLLIMLSACTQLPTPSEQQPTSQSSDKTSPVAVASPEQKAFHTKAGKEHTIIIPTPNDNPAAHRFPEAYKAYYVEGYMQAWNDSVLDRIIRYRPYNGKFADAQAEKNYRLYDGELFDLETYSQQLAAIGRTQQTEIFALSDETTAKRTGREDGQHAAKADVQKLIAQE